MSVASRLFGISDPQYHPEPDAGAFTGTLEVGAHDALQMLAAFGWAVGRRTNSPLLQQRGAQAFEAEQGYGEEAISELPRSRQRQLSEPIGFDNFSLATLGAQFLRQAPGIGVAAGATALGGPVAGMLTSGAMGTGDAMSSIVQEFGRLNPEDVEQIPYFKQFLDQGMSPEEALQAGTDKAVGNQDVIQMALQTSLGAVDPGVWLGRIVRGGGYRPGLGRVKTAAVGAPVAALGGAIEEGSAAVTQNIASGETEGFIPETSVSQAAIAGAILEGPGGAAAGLAGGGKPRQWEKVEPGQPDEAKNAALLGEPLALPPPSAYPIPGGPPDAPAGLIAPPVGREWREGEGWVRTQPSGQPVNTPDVINQPGATTPPLQITQRTDIQLPDQSIPEAGPDADPLVAPMVTRQALVEAGFQPAEIDAWDHDEAIEAIVSVQRERLEQQGVLNPGEIEDAVAELRQQVEAGIEVTPDPAYSERPRPTVIEDEEAPAGGPEIITPGVTLAEGPVGEAIPTAPPPVEGPVPSQRAPRARPPRPAPTTLPAETELSGAPPITTPENVVQPTIIEDEETAAPAPLPQRDTRTISEIFSPTEGAMQAVTQEPIGQTVEGSSILEAAPTQHDEELASIAKAKDTPLEAKNRRQIETDYPQFAGRTDLSVQDIVKRIAEDPPKAAALIEANQPIDEEGDAIGMITRLEHMLEQAAAEDISVPTRVTKNTPDEILFLADAARTVKALTKNLNNVETLLQFQANEQAARAGDFSLMRGTFGGKSVGRSGGVGATPGGVENIAGGMQAVDMEDAARREQEGEVGSVETLDERGAPEDAEASAAPTPSSKRSMNTYDPYIWVTDEETGVTKRIKNPMAKGVEVNVTPELQSRAAETAARAEQLGKSRALPRKKHVEYKEESQSGGDEGDTVVRRISGERFEKVTGRKPQPVATAEAIAKSKARQAREDAKANAVIAKKMAKREATETKPPTKAEQAKAALAGRKATRDAAKEQTRVAKEQAAERKARAPVEAPKESFEDRKKRIFAEIAARRSSGGVNAVKVKRDPSETVYSKSENTAHAPGAVEFFGEWVIPKETLTIRELVERFPTRTGKSTWVKTGSFHERVAGNSHAELVDRILETLVKTRPDMPVYMLNDADMHTASGKMLLDPKNTKAFFSHPDLAGSPHADTGFMAFRDVGNNRETIGHEGIHGLTHDMLQNSPRTRSQLEQVLAQILYDKPVFPEGTKNAPLDAQYYGLGSIEEMLSEITDPDFAQLLHEVPIPRELAKEMGLEGWRKATAWNGIVAAVRKMFNRMMQMIGLEPVHDFNAFDAVMATIERASHTYDTSGLAGYQSRAALAGSPMTDEGFLNAEGRARGTRAKIHALDTMRAVREGDPDLESFLNPVPEADAKRISGEVNTRATLEVVRAVKNRGSDFWSRVGKGSLYFRSRDSIMRGYEHMFPDGMLRAFINALARRDTLAQQMHAEDAKIMTDEARLFDKHRNDKIGKRSVQDVYEKSLMDQTMWQIDASIPLAQNTWIDGNKVASSHYDAIKKDYDSLPADMKTMMKRQFQWAKDKQRRVIDGVLTNTVLNAAKEPMTPAAALKLGRRVVDGEATNADVEKIGNTTAAKIKATPEFKMLKGPYAPMMRYGEHIVSAKVAVADPKSGKWRKVTSPQSYIVDFYGPDAEQQANKFASNREEYATVTPVWTDDQGRASINGEPFTGKDVISGAVKSHRVTIQDRHVEFFETEREAIDVADKLKGDKYYAEVKPVRLKSNTGETNEQAMGASTHLQSIMAELGKRDALAGLPPAVRAAAMASIQQAIYRAAPGTSISKRRMQRKHVAGASKDSLRAMQAYSHSMNNYIAGIETAHEIHETYKPLEESAGGDYSKGETAQAVLNELNERRNQRAGTYDQSGPIVNFATSWQFVDKLASPAYSIINLTQIPLITLPYLAAKYGMFNASRALSKAMSDIGFVEIMKLGGKESVKAFSDRLHTAVSYHDFVTKNNPKVTGAKVRMLNKLVEYGSLDPDAGFEAAKVRAKGPASTLLKRIEDTFRQFPRAVEASNRYGTALAAFDLATKKGMSEDAATEYARDAVDQTQFNYSASNASPIFNTSVGRVALQFMKYGASMYQLMGSQVANILSSKSTKAERVEAIKGLTYLVGAHVIMSGFGGLPLEPLKLVFTAGNMFGLTDMEWEDVEAGVREMTAGMVGATAAEYMSRGLPRALGIDVSNRVNLTDLLVHRPQVSFDERGGIGAYMWQFAGGATGGSLIDIPTGISMLFDGRIMEGVEKLVPIKTLSDISAAVRQGTTGKLSEARDPVLTFSPLDMFVKGVGFNPAPNANVSERRAMVARGTQYQEDQERSLKLDFYSADANARGKFGPRLNKYNAGLPRDEQLSMSDLREYVRDKEKNQKKAKGSIIPRSNQRLIDEALEVIPE